MARFTDKVVVISGGARGQGAAEARALVAEGARVILGDVLDAEGRALAHALGERAEYLPLDVADAAAWARVVAAAERHGGPHGFINNAGIYQPRPLLETEPELFERHMRTNQYGAYLGMRAVAAAMARRGGGSIVNISSTAGLRGSAHAFAYSATKWALRGMTKSAAIELAEHNIRVNSIHPGPIDTPMLLARTPAQNQERLQSVPMRRQGGVAEVVGLVLFLLSDESSYMTGAEVAVDGGASA